MAALASLHVAPLAIVALWLPFAIWRRVRRNVGRQPLVPWRLKLRSAVMAAIVMAIVAALAREGHFATVAAFGFGALAGIALSVHGVRLTRLGADDQGRFYVPNPWIGLALSGVLMARLGWRLWQMWPTLSQPDAAWPALTAPGPLTALLLGAVLVYYVAYSLGVLRRAAVPQPATTT